MIKARLGTAVQRVTISTKEAKPVYAQAWSNQNWVKLGPSISKGIVTIRWRSRFHPRRETVEARVTSKERQTTF